MNLYDQRLKANVTIARNKAEVESVSIPPPLWLHIPHHEQSWDDGQPWSMHGFDGTLYCCTTTLLNIDSRANVVSRMSYRFVPVDFDSLRTALAKEKMK